MDKTNLISSSGIWDIQLAKEKHKFDKLLCGAIASIYKPFRAVDLGCGLGHYCRVLHYGFGWPIVDGFEGTENIKWLSPNYANIQKVDLSTKIDDDIKYDFVLCLEVGEHIPAEKESIFIDNVCNLSLKDILLSWAIPDQGGKGHVNELPNASIISSFSKRGFAINYKKTKYCRKHSSLKWFKNTLMAFERKHA